MVTKPATQACALTKNQPATFRFLGPCSSQLSHTGQGKNKEFLHDMGCVTRIYCFIKLLPLYKLKRMLLGSTSLPCPCSGAMEEYRAWGEMAATAMSNGGWQAPQQ